MYIKSIKEYYISYCKMVVSDDTRSIICILDPFASDSDLIPTVGMEVATLIAYFREDFPKIVKVTDTSRQTYKLVKNGIFGMDYKVRGEVVDERKYILKVFDFYISLECLFSSEYINPQKFPYKDGDWIELIVDRFDAVIKG